VKLAHEGPNKALQLVETFKVKVLSQACRDATVVRRQKKGCATCGKPCETRVFAVHS
jgi:hypothetical protein